MPSAFGKGAFQASRPAVAVDAQGSITLGSEQGELGCGLTRGFALLGAVE